MSRYGVDEVCYRTRIPCIPCVKQMRASNDATEHQNSLCVHRQQRFSLGETTVHQPSARRSPGIMVQRRQSSGSRLLSYHRRQRALLASRVPQQLVRSESALSTTRYETVACCVCVGGTQVLSKFPSTCTLTQCGFVHFILRNCVNRCESG